MPKVWISGYLPSALASSDHQRMLSSARDTPAVRGDLRHAVFACQPFRGGRINQRHVDLVAVLLAELLKRPVGDKRVDDSQLARRNPGLYLGNGYAQKVGCPLPGVWVIPICKVSRNSFDGGGVQR